MDFLPHRQKKITWRAGHEKVLHRFRLRFRRDKPPGTGAKREIDRDAPPPKFLESLSEFGYSQEDGPRLEMYFDLSDLVVICYDELRELEAYAESLSANDGVE